MTEAEQGVRHGLTAGAAGGGVVAARAVEIGRHGLSAGSADGGVAAGRRGRRE